jgi:nitroimidazol reductase NimA-like FMN-containing flavoprotein (pyridoxamine 5'-phosphate oxidase superfamily)
MSGESPENRAEDVRLSPRAVDDDALIEAFLDRRPMGVLGLVDDGSPYVVNQLFVYDATERAIFLHGANIGRTRTVVEASDPAEASFTVSEMGRLLPAEKPVDFDVEYASVVAVGEIRRLDGRDEKRRALERLMAKFAPQLEAGEDYAPIADASIDRTSVYRLDVEEWSGKRNEPDGAPGAYDYDAVREATDRGE